MRSRVIDELDHKRDRKRSRGLYLFDDEASLQATFEGPLDAQVTSHPALSEFSVNQFDVMEEATAVTRGPMRQVSRLRF